MLKNNITVKINADDDKFGLILNSAVRYALDRRTYAVTSVVDFITPLIPHLNDKTLWCFDRDIKEQERFGGYGDPRIDEPVWMRFWDAVKREMAKRNDGVIRDDVY